MTQPPIVLVHGWAGSQAAWRSTRAAIAALAPDAVVRAVALPGAHGALEAATRSRVGPATIGGAVDAVVAVLEDLDAPGLVVGHSMGAQVTLLTQVRRPDLVAAEVVLDPAYASRASADDIESWADRIERRGHAELEAFFSGALDPAIPRTDRETVLADFHATPVPVIASYLRSEYSDPGAIGLREHTAPAARRRTRPVLAIHSTAAGADAERLLAAPPRSEIELWPGHCHFLHLQAPERTARRALTWAAALTGGPELVRGQHHRR
ncbi:MAG: alpha/beta hydrolase [Salana multivorans]|nr:alpha/beta hydrolase [Salana multivorans]